MAFLAVIRENGPLIIVNYVSKEEKIVSELKDDFFEKETLWSRKTKSSLLKSFSFTIFKEICDLNFSLVSAIHYKVVAIA